MPRPSPLALRNGERATAKPRRDHARPRGGPRPATIPIHPDPRPLCAGVQTIPKGAHAFRYRVLGPGHDVRIGALRSRVVHDTEHVTVVIDYFTEEQAHRVAAAGSGFFLGS